MCSLFTYNYLGIIHSKDENTARFAYRNARDGEWQNEIKSVVYVRCRSVAALYFGLVASDIRNASNENFRSTSDDVICLFLQRNRDDSISENLYCRGEINEVKVGTTCNNRNRYTDSANQKLNNYMLLLNLYRSKFEMYIVAPNSKWFVDKIDIRVTRWQETFLHDILARGCTR